MTQHRHHHHQHQHDNKKNKNHDNNQFTTVTRTSMDNNIATRDSRRPSTTLNAFPRRPLPTISLRRSSQEGEVELQETVRLRGKRERDRDRETSKRRRGFYSHSSEDEEETVGNEQDDDVFDTEFIRMISSNTASSMYDQCHRRTFRQTPPLPPPTYDNITRDIIGVPVPRKARSASVKRTHEEQSLKSSEEASPSSSVALRDKMNSSGPKTRLPKVDSESSCSTQGDLEMQVAELLSGLKDIDSLELSTTSFSSIPSSDDEKKKVEDNSSISQAQKDLNQSADVEKMLSPESARVSVCCDVGIASGDEIVSSEATKEGNEEHKLNSAAGFNVAPDVRYEEFTGESPWCSKSKLDLDKPEDSASTKYVSVVPEDKGQSVDKFVIDLMAPPPMMLSPERDNVSRGEGGVKIVDKAERLVKKEKSNQDKDEVKMDALKLSLEMPTLNVEGTNNKVEKQGRSNEQSTESKNPKEDKTGLSSSVPMSTVVQEQPSSSLCSLGYMLPLQAVVKMEKPTGLSTTPQHADSILSLPRAKRCATHHYIAHNILQQQRSKMNPFLPSGSLNDTKHTNINRMPSAESAVVGKHSQKHPLGVNQHATQEKGWDAFSDFNLAMARSSATAIQINSTQMKQLVLPQSPHPGSTGNLLHGQTFPFPSGQHQASVAGGVYSTSSAPSSNKSHSSAAGSLGTPSTLPAVTAAMSFSYPNLAANDTPFMTIVQNSGYPFPFSTPLGASATIRGANPAQSPPVLNGPLYTSQIFHPLQHLNSQALVPPSYLNASTSSGSSSSHKPPQGAQGNGNNILTSVTAQRQQSQKQSTSQSNPRKHENGVMTGENAQTVVSGTPYSQKNVFGQNFAIPVQPLDLSFRPSGASDSVGGNNGNFGDKQHEPHDLKGGVDRISSQAYAVPFSAFNGTSVPSSLNFSSMAQNPVIFPNLPDITWQGYHTANASHAAQQRICSTTEGKSGGNSSHQDDEKKATSGKPTTNGPTTLFFDNSSKNNLHFVSSPMNGNWHSRTVTSTSTTTSLPLASNASHSQQPLQLLHLQHQQHAMLQQQPSMATRYKASSTNATTATKFVSSSPTVFPQNLDQCKSSNQASQPKNSGITSDSHFHNTSILQGQGRVLHGHTQISFGGNYIPSLPPQGQQLVINNQSSFGTTVAGTPPNGGSLKTNSQGSKLVSSVSTSEMQQNEKSPAGTAQKSSPVCGRTVPSILSSCPSHLSELKY